MKRLLYVLTGLCLLAGLFTGCEKPNENSEEGDDTATKDYTETVFGINMEMVYVEGGTFEMGTTVEQGDDVWDSEPVRTIKLDSFYIGKYEVTQAQWKTVMGTNVKEQRDKVNPEYGIYGEGDNYSMYYINWEEAQEFCKKLSEATGKKYVLPTEAQWEYAARGGNKSQHYKYAGSDNIDDVAWYGEDDDNGTVHPIGGKNTNELGIYDMSGNVWEWCLDWYADYDENDTDNPQGPANGTYRIQRGGSWIDRAENCRVSSRLDNSPDDRSYIAGFRVVCSSK
ncbi:formylglycine-generating enzyme family protein [bacterium]|nr:formylglycine-generating enzyme family protein [bacterium]